MRMIRFRLEFLAVQLLDAFMLLFSWEAASDLGAFLGSQASWALPRRWKTANDNLAAAYPDMPAAEREALARKALSNAGRIGAEIIKSRHLTKEALFEKVRYENMEILDAALAEGKGVILNTGHLGNWETTGVVLTAHGYKLGVVGRLIKNPYVDAWLKETRCRFGLNLIAHKNPFFTSVKWLKGGNITAILIDHNIRKGGVFIPFFGRPAATSNLSALLAVRLGSPVVSVAITRQGSVQTCRIVGPMRANPDADPEAEIQRLTVAMVKQLEDFVKASPADWLWGHNRWKRAEEAAQETVAA